MPFDQITLAPARTRLAFMLGDPNMTFWTSNELDSYIREAISTWAVASLYYRSRAAFNTTANQAFYNLPSISSLSSQLAMSSIDRDLVSQLEYSLIEPQSTDWVNWTGTEQYDLATLQKAVERARDRFLLESGLIFTEQEIDTSSPPVSRVAMPDSVIDVRRVASKSTDGNYRTLSREDELTLGSYSPDWNIPTINHPKPNYFSQISEPNLTVQLAPVAIDITKLHLITINQGASLDVTQSVKLGICEPFSWVTKYGALWDLLGPHTQNYDPLRADYCQKRYQEGIQLTDLYFSVINAEVNGKQINISSLTDLDQYIWNWRNIFGTPTQMGIATWNLLALYPVPNSNNISITLDLISNPPLPVNDGDDIQIDAANYPTLLDFARHLAMFKRGGQEFAQSMPCYDSLMRAAALNNDRLRAQSRFFSSLTDSSSKEESQRPIASEGQEKQQLDQAA